MIGRRVITSHGRAGTVIDHDAEADLVQVTVDDEPGVQVHRVDTLTLVVQLPTPRPF